MDKVKTFFLVFVVLVSIGHAEVYKHVDKQGRVHFSDRPPAKQKSEKITIRKINSIKGPAVVTKKRGKSANNKNKIVMYSAEWCGVCKRAKRYFNANKISFVEYDIDKSRKAKREFQKLQGKGVPLILVGDYKMAGFDQRFFDKYYLNRK